MGLGRMTDVRDLEWSFQIFGQQAGPSCSILIEPKIVLRTNNAHPSLPTSI